jgi:hypothetical protein
MEEAGTLVAATVVKPGGATHGETGSEGSVHATRR